MRGVRWIKQYLSQGYLQVARILLQYDVDRAIHSNMISSRQAFTVPASGVHALKIEPAPLLSSFKGEVPGAVFDNHVSDWEMHSSLGHFGTRDHCILYICAAHTVWHRRV